jgi:hypothetical protein
MFSGQAVPISFVKRLPISWTISFPNCELNTTVSTGGAPFSAIKWLYTPNFSENSACS